MAILTFHFCKRLLEMLLTCCFLCLLVACGTSATAAPQPSPTSIGGTPVPATTGGQAASDSGKTYNPTPVSTTVPVPLTQTSCPTSGTGRAAVLAPLATHGHKTLVYYVGTGQNTHDPLVATLKGLDVATGTKTTILSMPQAVIKQIVISTDGQWILFITNVTVGGQLQNKLQLVRMDGKGLQTLYCGTADMQLDNKSVVWSNNQRTILMELYGAHGNISVLDTRTGNVHVALTTPMSLATMLDNTRAYIKVPATDAPSSTLAILDLSKGANQHPNNLITVFQQTPPNGNYPCWDADSSYNAATLYISQCKTVSSTTGPGIAGDTGPSTIDTQAPTGGTLHNVYTNAQLAVTDMRAVSPNTLLLQTKTVNTPYGSTLNGLWAIHTDGTGRVRLASEGTLNIFDQAPWANVSRDNASYAFQNARPDGSYTLGYGSLDGTQTTIFATISNAQLLIVGWTNL